MHFNLFGDSWAWNWNFHEERFSSKEILKLRPPRTRTDLDGIAPNYFKDCFAQLEMMLKSLGHTVSTHNVPVYSFDRTVNKIVDTSEKADYNIVFFSDLMRQGNLHQFRTNVSLDDWLTQYHAKLKEQLERVATHADKTGQTYIIFGGQSTLLKDEFALYNTSPNVILGAECIISTILAKYVMDPDPTITSWCRDNFPLSRFKFCDFCHMLNTEDFADDLLREIVQGVLRIDPMSESDVDMSLIRLVTQPDSCHMNPGAVYYFVDMLFTVIERLEARK